MRKMCWFLGQFCSAEFLVPYFAMLYWTLDKFKCVYGIWLLTLSEITNGLLKWWFRVPRPGWVDGQIKMKAWSHEYSFPSSHAQLIWSLATFFSGTSIGYLRHRLYGSWGKTAVAYWYFLAAPFLFAALVCLSRVYEGVHYPRDVLVGAAAGVSLAAVYMRVFPIINALVMKLPLWARVIVLQGVALACTKALQWSHAHAQASEPQENVSTWVSTAAVGDHKGKAIIPHSVPLSSYLGMVGVLSGLALGVPLAHKFPHQLPTSFLTAALRLASGNTVLFATYFLLRYIEKKMFKEGEAGQRLTRFLRYFSVPVVILIVAPTLFKRLRI